MIERIEEKESDGDDVVVVVVVIDVVVGVGVGVDVGLRTLSGVRWRQGWVAVAAKEAMCEVE